MKHFRPLLLAAVLGTVAPAMAQDKPVTHTNVGVHLACVTGPANSQGRVSLACHGTVAQADAMRAASSNRAPVTFMVDSATVYPVPRGPKPSR